MDPVIRTIVEVLLTVLNLYQWVFIISAVMSWLIAFGVVNTYNRFVNTVVDITGRLTEPLLRPIRRVVPDIGGVDISFIVAILILFALQRLLVNFMAYSAF
ncbi:MAG: YggT family protein [Azospirillaceae bacterium]|nr:YggT family protein [Azospirillaceae bacterium]